MDAGAAAAVAAARAPCAGQFETEVVLFYVLPIRIFRNHNVKLGERARARGHCSGVLLACALFMLPPLDRWLTGMDGDAGGGGKDCSRPEIGET